MSIAGALVVYIIAWWMVFFTLLPIGIRHEHEVEEGQDPGAPTNPNLWKKMAGATVIAGVILAGFWAVLEYDLITIPDSPMFSN